MPFQKYNSSTAKSLFKATPPAASRSQPSSSRSVEAQNNDGKAAPATESLKSRLDRTRALIAGIQKERYKSDLERSRMGLKEAAKARIEAAQRAALDEELRNEALEELRKQELPLVTQRLEDELRPKVQESLLAELRAELQPKVHAELRAELVEEATDKVWAELQEQLRDDVEDNLRLELEETLADSVRDKLYHDLYPEVVAQLKEEYRDMVLLQLKEEVAADELAKDPIVNGRFEDALDPALMAESEASDIGQPPSTLAVLAKRRFSEGFEDEDPETRTKKLKMVNDDKELVDAPASLLLSSNLVRFKDSSAGQPNESLDEGEKADAEDELGNRLTMESIDKSSVQAVAKAKRHHTPEDVNADGGDELSDEDPDRNEQPGNQDADAVTEMETDEMGAIGAVPRRRSSQEPQVVAYPQISTPDLHPAEHDISIKLPPPESLVEAYETSQNKETIVNGIISEGPQAENLPSSSSEHNNTASQSSSPMTQSWTHIGPPKQHSFSNKTLPENPDSASKAIPQLFSQTNHSTPSDQQSENGDESDNNDPDVIHEGLDSDEGASENSNEELDEEATDENADVSSNENEDREQSEEADEEADNDDEEIDEDEMEDEQEEDDLNDSDAPSASHLDPMLHSPYTRLPSYTSYSQGGHQDDPIALDSD